MQPKIPFVCLPSPAILKYSASEGFSAHDLLCKVNFTLSDDFALKHTNKDNGIPSWLVGEVLRLKKLHIDVHFSGGKKVIFFILSFLVNQVGFKYS